MHAVAPAGLPAALPPLVCPPAACPLAAASAESMVMHSPLPLCPASAAWSRLLQRVPGVVATCSGYAQGHVDQPTYEQVRSIGVMVCVFVGCACLDRRHATACAGGSQLLPSSTASCLPLTLAVPRWPPFKPWLHPALAGVTPKPPPAMELSPPAGVQRAHRAHGGGTADVPAG